MGKLSEMRRRLFDIGRRRKNDEDLREEMSVHLELKIQENARNGMSEDDACRNACREFGNSAKIHEESREVWRYGVLQGLALDFRHAARMLQRHPAFAVIAVLTLALGFGANSAIFSVVDAVLLRPLPYDQPDRLVFLTEASRTMPQVSISMANFDDWRSMNTVFEGLAPYLSNQIVLTGQGQAEQLPIREITADFCHTLRVQPILGRDLTPPDDRIGSAAVVLLSDWFWTSKFARNPNVIGSTLTLDGELHTIVGVLPSSQFHGSWRQIALFRSLWRHEDTLGGSARRNERVGIYAIARMKPGVTLPDARADMDHVSARLAKAFPESNSGYGVNVDSLLNSMVGEARPALLVLLSTVGFVLLIACTTLANLMLARATERHREMALRTALGSGQFRLIRQLLAESLLLAALGASLGLLATYWMVSAIAGAASSNFPRLDEVSLDRSVLLFTLGLAFATGIIFGILPAWQVSRRHLKDSINENGRGTGPNSRNRRAWAVSAVLEVAISMVLLIGAGLMLRSLYSLLRTDPGFDSSHVLTVGITFPDSVYKDPAKRRSVLEKLVEDVSAASKIDAVGYVQPLLGGNQNEYAIRNHPDRASVAGRETDVTEVSSGAMSAMGLHMVRGRFITSADVADSAPVCLIDTTLAKIGWADESPIGKQISVGDSPGPPYRSPYWRTIVGVVAHVKNYGVDQPSREETYIPYTQALLERGSLVIRSSADATYIASVMRAKLQAIDPNLPLSTVRTLEEIVGRNVASRRLLVILLSSFASLATILAALGIYGVMSYTVILRKEEIGIRMTLGALPSAVTRLILRSGLTLVSLGIATGFLVAVSLCPLLQPLLYKVKPTDTLTLATVPVVVGLVAFAACYIPARRASRLSPMTLLRND